MRDNTSERLFNFRSYFQVPNESKIAANPDGTLRLEIENVKDSHIGVYKCTATSLRDKTVVWTEGRLDTPGLNSFHYLLAHSHTWVSLTFQLTIQHTLKSHGKWRIPHWMFLNFRRAVSYDDFREDWTPWVHWTSPFLQRWHRRSCGDEMQGEWGE